MIEYNAHKSNEKGMNRPKVFRLAMNDELWHFVVVFPFVTCGERDEADLVGKGGNIKEDTNRNNEFLFQWNPAGHERGIRSTHTQQKTGKNIRTVRSSYGADVFIRTKYTALVGLKLPEASAASNAIDWWKG